MIELVSGLEHEKYSKSNRHKLGKLCPHGHDHTGKRQSYRTVDNSTCVTCSNIRVSNYYRSHVGRATAKKSKQKNASKIIAASANYRKKKKYSLLEYNRQYRSKNKDWYLRYYRSYNRARTARIMQAMPSWANLDEIKRIYQEAVRLTDETGVKYEVDHIVPLKSKKVCGLHVDWNLQILTKSDNSAKGNRKWPDM